MYSNARDLLSACNRRTSTPKAVWIESNLHNHPSPPQARIGYTDLIGVDWTEYFDRTNHQRRQLLIRLKPLAVFSNPETSSAGTAEIIAMKIPRYDRVVHLKQCVLDKDAATTAAGTSECCSDLQ